MLWTSTPVFNNSFAHRLGARQLRQCVRRTCRMCVPSQIFAWEWPSCKGEARCGNECRRKKKQS